MKKIKTINFLVTYEYPQGTGNFIASNTNWRFPSYEYLRTEISKWANIIASQIIISSIFEFKNERDFIDFKEPLPPELSEDNQ